MYCRRLKSSNILLESDFRAKITNFDLARSAEGKDAEFALTRHIVGTRGKHVSDIYEKVNANISEVLDEVLEEEKIDEKERLANFIDPRLQGNYRPELAMSVIILMTRYE
ncbi:LysM domain receptor-like kinase 4 [Tanacetum coccineum]